MTGETGRKANWCVWSLKTQILALRSINIRLWSGLVRQVWSSAGLTKR